MAFTVQWDVGVDILGVLLGLLNNDGWRETFTIGSGKDKYRALEWLLLSSLHLPHLFTLKENVGTYDLVPPSIRIKPNFITVTYLSGFWLDIVEVRRDDHFFQERLLVFIIIPQVFQSFVYFFDVFLY